MNRISFISLCSHHEYSLLFLCIQVGNIDATNWVMNWSSRPEIVPPRWAHHVLYAYCASLSVTIDGLISLVMVRYLHCLMMAPLTQCLLHKCAASQSFSAKEDVTSATYFGAINGLIGRWAFLHVWELIWHTRVTHLICSLVTCTVWVKKNPPLRFSDIFSQTVRNFWSKFYMPIIRSYLR